MSGRFLAGKILRPNLRRIPSMKKRLTIFVINGFTLGFLCLLISNPAHAAQDPQTPEASQTPASSYQPKFPGDPARSDSEADALAYIRVAMRAEHVFNKHYGHYATSLAELVHTGTFTKRMVNPDRGDYHVSFKGKEDSFAIGMTPNHLDADHRSFFGNEDGKIHAEEDKTADDKSPVISKAFR
jgi:hypothetical protein